MELRDYIGIAKRWWWLMILSAVVAAVIGYGVSQRLTPVYQATTTIMVGQPIQATSLADLNFETGEQLTETYADIAVRQPVLQGVVETLKLSDTWRALKKRVQVKPVYRTQLLEITVEANSPEEARVTADEIARQLILLSPTDPQSQESDENRRFIRDRLRNLQTKIEAGQERVKALEAAMAGSLSADQVQELQHEINTLESLITNWENNFSQLLLLTENDKSPNHLTVIEPAQVDPSSTRPDIVLNTVLAGMVGFSLALGIIFLLEYLDDTLKSAGDLNQSLGLTVLGVVGHIQGKQYPDKLIASQDRFAPITEAYRMIRSSIQFVFVDQLANSIMVTSPTPGEGKSITVANLGVIMAQAGLKTIVVDTDLRQPVLHQIFQVANEEGLTEALRSPTLEINDYLRDTGVKNLRMITSGVLPPNPSELLGSPRMGQLVAGLSELADMVIYDSPPAAVVTDAAVLSSRVDGVILVIQAGQTRRDAARQAIFTLQQAGANLLGGVLNRVAQKRRGYYYYAYYPPGERELTGQPAHPGRRRQP